MSTKSITLEELEKELASAIKMRDEYRAKAKEKQKEISAARYKIRTAKNNGGVYTPTGRTKMEKEKALSEALSKNKDKATITMDTSPVVRLVQSKTSIYDNLEVEDADIIEKLNEYIARDLYAKVGVIIINMEADGVDKKMIAEELGLSENLYKRCVSAIVSRIVWAVDDAIEKIKESDGK